MCAARLAASGPAADGLDLDACYAAAWQGLYGSLLEGREVANPAGWLVVVTLRRALDELRATVPTAHAVRVDGDRDAVAHALRDERDLEAELDDRARIAQLVEGMPAPRPARAGGGDAVLPARPLARARRRRAWASARAMRKLMDGGRAGREGVAAKVGRVLDAIREGRWCEEQRSLMRRSRSACSTPRASATAWRAPIANAAPPAAPTSLSLRGLAALLPPPLLPLLRDASVGHGAGAGAGAGKGAGASIAASGGASAGGAGAGGGAGMGGGWMLGGAPLGAKLAVGCALVLGVGVGCSQLVPGGAAAGAHRPGRGRVSTAPRSRPAGPGPGAGLVATAPPGRRVPPRPRRRPRPARATRGVAGGKSASAEFGPERAVATARARDGAAGGEQPSVGGALQRPAPAGVSAAAREFAP